MRYFVTIEGVEHHVDVTPSTTGFDVLYDGKPVEVDMLDLDGSLSLRIGGHMIDLTAEGSPPNLGVVASGRRVYLDVQSARMKAANSASSKSKGGGSGLIVSPMPGRVLKLLVNPGDHVEVGTSLVVVEAMKMENELRATRAGTVQEFFVKPGDTVEGGAKLVRVGD
ncbi:MAG: biotin/lipoyl-containing protein [Polyangiaceae bacterium]